MLTQNQKIIKDDLKMEEIEMAIDKIVSNKVQKYQVQSNKLQSIAF